MANRPQRYRITVTPLEADGLPCTSRCTIEFEHHCHDDWMRVLENVQRLRGFTGDERTALVIGAKLLGSLMADHRNDQDDLFASLRPHVEVFLQDLKQRAPG